MRPFLQCYVHGSGHKFSHLSCFGVHGKPVTTHLQGIATRYVSLSWYDLGPGFFPLSHASSDAMTTAKITLQQFKDETEPELKRGPISRILLLSLCLPDRS